MITLNYFQKFRMKYGVMIMNKEIILQSGVRAIEAEYKDQYIDEYNSNPFIQCLPQIKSEHEIIKALTYNPNIKKEEVFLDGSIKLHILQRVYKFFQPLPIHLKIWNMIDTLIRQSYVARNPFDPNYKRYINETGNRIINKNFSLDCNENFRTTASCGLLIGFSGMGKTTTVNMVLKSIPSIICHDTYNNIQFTQIQVPWIKLEAPYNGSLKSLTYQLFMKIDDLLGENNFKKYVSRNLSTDAMLPILGRLCNSIGLGLLVIDELQHLNKSGVNQTMNYFVAMMNTFGISLLLIGTPASYDMLKTEMRIARRVTGNSEVIWNNMDNGNEFRLFMKGLWRYQWLHNKVELTEEIINLIYQKSQGISDLVVKIFVNSQKIAIEKGLEILNKEIIEKVADEEFKLLAPILEAIRSKNPSKLIRYDDVSRINTSLVNTQEIKSTVVSKKKSAKESENITKKITEEIIKEVKTKKKIKVSELGERDIRRIVIEGLSTGLDEYESLKKNGNIDNLEFLGIGDVI